MAPKQFFFSEGAAADPAPDPGASPSASVGARIFWAGLEGVPPPAFGAPQMYPQCCWIPVHRAVRPLLLPDLLGAEVAAGAAPDPGASPSASLGAPIPDSG